MKKRVRDKIKYSAVRQIFTSKGKEKDTIDDIKMLTKFTIVGVSILLGVICIAGIIEFLIKM